MCRHCWEGEDDGPLVQPCACRGTAKWIHAHCLEQWRRTNPREDAAYRCGQCMDRYRDALSLELLRARLQAERTCQTTCLTAPPKEARAPTGGLRTRPCTRDKLAKELQVQGKYEEAEPLYREALEVKRETLGNRHPRLLYAKGDLAAAQLLTREALLKVRRETLGNRHPSTLTSINNLAMLLKGKGDLAAAKPLMREEALEGLRDTQDDQHPSTLTFINRLAMLLKDRADFAAA